MGIVLSLVHIFSRITFRCSLLDMCNYLARTMSAKPPKTLTANSLLAVKNRLLGIFSKFAFHPRLGRSNEGHV